MDLDPLVAAARRDLKLMWWRLAVPSQTVRTRVRPRTYRSTVPPWFTALIGPHTRTVTALVIAGGCALVITALIGWPAAAIAAIGIPTAQRYRTQRRIIAARRRIADALPDGIDMLVLLIQSGCSPIRAFEQLAALCDPVLAPPLAQVVQRLRRGCGLGEAVGVLTESLGPQMIPVVDALRSADHYGTPLGPALDRITDHLLRERRHRAEVAARTLAVRITFPLVVCILPAFALGALTPVLLGALGSITRLDIGDVPTPLP